MYIFLFRLADFSGWSITVVVADSEEQARNLLLESHQDDKGWELFDKVSAMAPSVVYEDYE